MRSLTASSSCLFGLVLVSALAISSPMAEAGAVDLRSTMEASVTEIERRLKLTSRQFAKVGSVLRKSIDRSMAVLRKYGVTPGIRPPITVLISIQSEMDRIHTDVHRQLEPILSNKDLRTVDELGHRMIRKVQAILLQE